MKNGFAVLIMSVVAVSATAKPNGHTPAGPSVGSATAADATISHTAATAFAWSTVNPNQYNSGNTSGFSAVFAAPAYTDNPLGTWSLVGKATDGVTTSSATINGATLTYTVTASKNATTGTFSIMSDKVMTLDLALAVHAANASGAWLFNDLNLQANTTQSGTFAINWLNNGGNVPDYSNATLFARDIKAGGGNTGVSPVPEADSYAMMIAGLGLIAFLKRRKKSFAVTTSHA